MCIPAVGRGQSGTRHCVHGVMSPFSGFLFRVENCLMETVCVSEQHDVQLDYYGKRLATASSDRMIKIFDVSPDQTQHQLSATIQAHEGPVWQVAWAHPKFGRCSMMPVYDCIACPRTRPACVHACARRACKALRAPDPVQRLHVAPHQQAGPLFDLNRTGVFVCVRAAFWPRAPTTARYVFGGKPSRNSGPRFTSTPTTSLRSTASALRRTRWA